MRYYVTTQAAHIPSHHQIIMVDGTVPGWKAQPGDLHWDHHRPHGAAIQIDEIPIPTQDSIIERHRDRLPPCIVTTMLDADACCAAAWVQLSAKALIPDTCSKLQAIAWDCDHLYVPEPLSHLAEFAAKAVATLNQDYFQLAKTQQLPNQQQQWTIQQREFLDTLAFQFHTEWLMAAARGDRPYPGELCEADGYWQQICTDAQQILDEQRIYCLAPAELTTHLRAIAVFDLRNLDHSVSPKASLEALARITPLSQLRPETITIHDHPQGGIKYILGCIPHHPDSQSLDFTQTLFQALTQAERQFYPEADPWGGRRSVGGSGWNTPSLLSPQHIQAIIWEQDQALLPPTRAEKFR